MKHTPGPWEKCFYPGYSPDGFSRMVNGKNGEFICATSIPGIQPLGTVDQHYNATLIATAPEMYEALDRLVKMESDMDHEDFDAEYEMRYFIENVAIPLLKKAKGEP